MMRWSTASYDAGSPIPNELVLGLGEGLAEPQERLLEVGQQQPRTTNAGDSESFGMGEGDGPEGLVGRREIDDIENAEGTDRFKVRADRLQNGARNRLRPEDADVDIGPAVRRAGRFGAEQVYLVVRQGNMSSDRGPNSVPQATARQDWRGGASAGRHARRIPQGGPPDGMVLVTADRPTEGLKGFPRFDGSGIQR